MYTPNLAQASCVMAGEPAAACQNRARLAGAGELAKKYPGCLEYVVVHEMMHHLERDHGARFTKLMDRSIPNWQSLCDQLNDAPLADDRRDVRDAD